MDSNLSRIRSALRTENKPFGNFGRAKVKAGSSLNGLGETQAEVIRIADRADYINRMITLLDCDDPKMRKFAYQELHRLNAFMEKRLGPEKPCNLEYLEGRL